MNLEDERGPVPPGPPAVEARPLSEEDMERLMAPFGTFEPAPRLALGVSGGADSLALAVLMQAWAAARGGSVTALIVDHGLRADSTAEARHVGALLASLDIEHHLLAWRGPKPQSGQQAAARRARYGLLSAWCARHGVLHLATAHHQDDQAETFLLRLGRGSGSDGLAGIPALRELGDLRLLRPFLPVPKARLEATLRSRGLAWIDDPANANPAYARTRLRRLRPRLEAEALGAPRLAAAAEHLGRVRAALEQAVASVLARAVSIDPAGFAWLEPGPLVRSGTEIGLRALARVLMTVGGADYPPRLERLERLFDRLRAGLARGATLGGCRILPRRGRLLVVREAAAIAPLAVRPGERLHWDGRFDVVIARDAGLAAETLVLGALGEPGRKGLSASPAGASVQALPPAARPGLPALSDRRSLLLVPDLCYAGGAKSGSALEKCAFAPKNPLTAGWFTVA